MPRLYVHQQQDTFKDAFPFHIHTSQAVEIKYELN